MMRMIRTQAQRGGKGEKRGKRHGRTVNEESGKVILSIIILIILIVLIVQITFIIVIRGRM
jgi:hypothetical protein